MSVLLELIAAYQRQHVQILMVVTSVHVVQVTLEMDSLVTVCPATGSVFAICYCFLNNSIPTDIDECSMENTCDSKADCENTFGSYMCSCQAGYSGDGNSCEGSYSDRHSTAIYNTLIYLLVTIAFSLPCRY